MTRSGSGRDQPPLRLVGEDEDTVVRSASARARVKRRPRPPAGSFSGAASNLRRNQSTDGALSSEAKVFPRDLSV